MKVRLKNNRYKAAGFAYDPKSDKFVKVWIDIGGGVRIFGLKKWNLPVPISAR